MAYDQGRQDALNGKDMLANPYPFDDPRHGEWVKGWMDGRKELAQRR